MVDFHSDQTCVTAIQSAQKSLDEVDTAQTALTAAITDLAESAQSIADSSSATGSPLPSAGGSSSATPSASPSASPSARASSGPTSGGGSDGSTHGRSPSGGGTSGGAPAAGGSGSGSGSGSAGGSSGGSAGGGSGQSTSVAESTADVAKAKLALTQAEVDLDHATLTAPISGTVASVPFTKGESMSASDAIEIVGNGAVQLTVDISESSIRSIELGQHATVSPSPGTSYPAEVTYIDLLPSSDSSSSVTYPVTLTVSSATVKKHAKALSDGVSASASITVASATDAVLVPVSAVTPTGDGTGTVTVVGDTGGTATDVELGVMDATRVQITKGLDAGATISLANRTAALPTSSTSTRRSGGSSLTGGTGGFTGSGTRGFTGGGSAGR